VIFFGNQNIIRNIISSCLISIVITISIPISIYLGNKDSISLPFWNTVLISIFFFFIFFSAFVLIGFVLRQSWYANVLIAVAMFVLIKLYLLPSSAPVLDGEEHFSTWSSVEGLFSIATWLLLPVALFVSFKLPTDAVAFLIAVALALSVQPAFVDQKPFDADMLNRPDNSIFEYSPEKNVIVLLIDALPGDIFAEIIKRREDIRAEFDGFTLFPNAVSSAPTTLMNMHSIYSGRPYTGGSIRDHYMQAAKDGIFSDARSNGYESVHLGPATYVCGADKCVKREDMMGYGRLENAIGSYLLLVETAALRVAPTPMHEWMYNRGNGRLFVAKYPVGHVEQSIAVFRHSHKVVSAAAEKPATFRFLHLFVSHPPLSVDEKCNPAEPGKITRAAFSAQSECGLDLLATYLKSIKANGVYANSTIVVVSDHGTDTIAPTDEQPFVYEGIRMISGRAQRFNPTFAVKPALASGEIEINYAPVANSDLRATLCALAFECPNDVKGRDVFSVHEQARERWFFEFGYFMSELMRLDTLPKEKVTQHVITGDATEIAGALKKPVARSDL